jgi:hypothetical protein
MRLPVGSGMALVSRADGRVLSRDSFRFPGARCHSHGEHVKLLLVAATDYTGCNLLACVCCDEASRRDKEASHLLLQ